jgi:hypothetical protein
MGDKENKKIDFIVYETSMNRLERTNKRQFALNIVLIIVLFLSYAGIILYSMIPEEDTSSKVNTQEINDIENIENSEISNGGE